MRVKFLKPSFYKKKITFILIVKVRQMRQTERFSNRIK